MPLEFITDTVDNSGTVRGQCTLAVSNSNLPSIVYTTNVGEVKLAQQTPEGEWIKTTLPFEPAAHDEYRVSLDFDDSDDPQPHVAYVSALTDRLIYGVRRGRWEFEEVPTQGGLCPGRVRFPSMHLYKGFAEIDGAFKNSPHICYQPAQGILELRHAAKLRPRDNPAASPVWEKHVHTVDTASPEAGWFATLNISNDDTIRIAYFDDFSSLGRTERRLHVATMHTDAEIPDRPLAAPDEGWFRQNLDGIGILGSWAALGQSITGDCAISYFDASVRALKLCLFGNFPAAVEIVAADIGEVRSSVGVSHRFRWCVTYGSGGRLRFATRTADSDGHGSFTTVDVDAGGDWPHMVFDDAGNVQVAHVAGGTLKYAMAARESD
jgi:hypothetical protein